MNQNQSKKIWVTKQAFTWTKILNTPFWAIYTLLPFIIMKDLKATTWQISLIVSLSPIISLLSLYWSALIKQRPDRLKANIVWASILGHLPFFFTFYVESSWFFVAASATYMLFWRGANPAWMEILKINIPQTLRQQVFAYGSAFYHVGGAILSISIGLMLDMQPTAWRWIFPLTATISLIAIFLQLFIPIDKNFNETDVADDEKFNGLTWQNILAPWQHAWKLVSTRKDFAKFQIGFMLAGSALMLWKPAAPIFFIKILHLNYKELAIAMTLCKSLGYIFALPGWTKLLEKINIFRFTAYVTAITALFPLFLFASTYNIAFLYAAYILYGMMQSGSELSWNLSGPLFSNKEDSSTFSSVNILTVGLRGCLAPPLGSLICMFAGPVTVLLIGSALSLLATAKMRSSYLESLPESTF